MFLSQGFEVLEEIEEAINKTKPGNLTALSSKFYTTIPHDFGRKIPPVINTLESLQNRYDMLAVSDCTCVSMSISHWPSIIGEPVLRSLKEFVVAAKQRLCLIYLFVR